MFARWWWRRIATRIALAMLLGTAFATVSSDGTRANLSVTDAAGAILAMPDAASDSALLTWNGRDLDGTPIRAGNARLQFQHRKEGHMIELRSQRWTMRTASSMTLGIRSNTR